jgi:hypothetical protein
MAKYNYPDNWRKLTPLERDNWHRRMGALGRRVRFQEEYFKRFGYPWRMVWRNGEWQDPHPQSYYDRIARSISDYSMKVVRPNLGVFFMDTIA